MREGLKAAARLAGAVGKSAVEAVFPAKCLACGEFIAARNPETGFGQTKASVDSGLWKKHLTAFACNDCLIDLRPAASPVCDSCGLVFVSRTGSDHLCETCIRSPNHFQRARSALIYTDSCAHLVHAFKYGGKLQLAKPLGAILRAAFNQFWSPGDFDLIVPVPLHRLKLRQRGFNQVWLMMHQWAQLDKASADSGLVRTFDFDVLARTTSTAAQSGLRRKERLANLRGAFDLKGTRNITGLRVLVVDDVYTTGATASECARTLRKHGAGRVDVLTLARAV